VAELFFQSSRESRLRENVEDLKKVLFQVRREVSQEYDSIRGPPTRPGSDTGKVGCEAPAGGMDQETMRKRLLYLFIRDLSSGICGDVLTNKARRDNLFLTDPWAASRRVTFRSKFFSWIFVIFLNIALLFYVYLFAMRQPHSRQSAWFQSFVTWLLFEIFISSTGIVFFFHLLIPFYVLTELSHLKEKVLLSLLLFREKYLHGGRRLRQQPHPTQTINRNEESPTHFNSAKYLFTSWRVAALFPELPESGLILQFHTPWPRKKLGVAEAEVAREYDQAILLTALSRVLLFFLTSLLHYHTLVQDLIIQLVSDSSLGVVVLICIQSAHIHPLLPLAEALVLVLCLGLLLRLTLNARNKDVKRFQLIQPMLGEDGEEGEGEIGERGPQVSQGPPDHPGEGHSQGEVCPSPTPTPVEAYIEIRQPTLVGRLEVDLEMGPK
jgi:hypothetical protein